MAVEANKATYACGVAADKLKVCEKSGNTNICYCDKADCNDIMQCECDGDDKTTYANKDKNKEWAAAENSAHGMISKTVSTVLAAFGAWWLL